MPRRRARVRRAGRSRPGEVRDEEADLDRRGGGSVARSERRVGMRGRAPDRPAAGAEAPEEGRREEGRQEGAGKTGAGAEREAVAAPSLRLRARCAMTRGSGGAMAERYIVVGG